MAAIRRPTSHLVVSKAVRAQVRRKQVFQSTVPFPYWLSKIDWMKLDLWPVNYSDKIYIWLFLLHRTKEIQGAGIINLSRRYFRHHRGSHLLVSCQVVNIELKEPVLIKKILFPLQENSAAKTRRDGLAVGMQSAELFVGYSIECFTCTEPYCSRAMA